MTTPTAKFQQDLDKRLLAIAQTGVTAETVSSLMMYTRRVVEDARTKKTFKITWLFCTWSMHTTMDQNVAIPGILEEVNDIVYACLQGSYAGMPVLAISEKLKLEELRSELQAICNSSNVDDSIIKDDVLWEQIRHQILDIVCEVPLSLKEKDIKSLIDKYPGATRIVTSILITDKSGSPIMNDDSYYWRIELTDLSDLTAAPVCMVGAVML